MSTQDPVTLSGIQGSPYTRKMLALLRYRRIPYAFVTPAQAAARGLPKARVPLNPTFYLPALDGTLEAVTDSSPVIRRLETEVAGRAVIPPDPAVAFLDMLLEDYADEWLTKATFHYRWTREADIARSTAMLPLWFEPTRPDDQIAAEGQAYAARQIGRLSVVGSSPETAPLIEAAYARFVDLMGSHLRDRPFLMGGRPGASDFAVFGQLSQLALFDPTPMALTLTRAPRVFAWTSIAEDLTGLEPDDRDWFTRGAVPKTLIDILGEAGRTYAPVMLPNAQAVAAAAERVETTVDGRPWAQQPFRYQAKCLGWLRESYAALDRAARKAVDALLAGTGCERLFVG